MKTFVDDRDVEIKGEHLKGLFLEVVVAGGIGSIESPKFIRELRRYGAEIRVWMTPGAMQFITPLVFEWASKNSVVTELSGSAEHISRADAVIVLPASLDFLSKLSLGLADSSALTMAQSLLGRKPVLLAASMHESLRENPLLEKNIQRLREIPHLNFLSERKSEAKSKVQFPDVLAAEVMHFISRSPLKGKSAVVSLGPTRSYFDDIRFLSNRSSGALGIQIADEFYRRGMNIQGVAGPLQMNFPSHLEQTSVETAAEMKIAFEKLAKESQAEIGVFSAAVLDFEAKQTEVGKKSSAQSTWNVELLRAPKLIESVRAPSLKIKVGFKLESRISEAELKERMLEWAKKNQCQILIGNRLEDLKAEAHQAYLLNTATKEFITAKTKKEIAMKLADLLEKIS